MTPFRRGTITRRLRLVPIGSRQSWLEFEIQRLECRDCGAVRQENLTFAKPHKRYTRAFARYVLDLSHIGTIKDVARHLGVGWDLVAEIQREQLEKDVRKTDLSTVTRIALDELAIGKGQRYVSIVLDRFLHHAEVIPMQGRSHRLKERTTPPREHVENAP